MNRPGGQGRVRAGCIDVLQMTSQKLSETLRSTGRHIDDQVGLLVSVNVYSLCVIVVNMGF